MNRETITNVIGYIVNDISVQGGNTDAGNYRAYVEFTHADGDNNSYRVMSLSSLRSLGKIAADLDVFDVEFLYYGADEDLVSDVVVIEHKSVNPILALAETLNKARITANSIEATAPQNDVYGAISDALVKTLAHLVTPEYVAYAMDSLMTDGATIPAAIQHANECERIATTPQPLDDEVYICAGCYHKHHNGDAMADQSVTWTDNTNVEDENDSGVIDFSGMPCGCCGTTLAGKRFRMAIWEL